MSKLIDLTGKRFGRILVLSRAVTRSNKGTRWKCKCNCGKIFFVRSWSLRNGLSTSCGCYSAELKYKHGREPKKLYYVWHHMKDRCFNPNNKRYHHYGGRGITVCDEWRSDFVAFREWSLANGYREGLTIDRIDNNGNYQPENCRWITNFEQQSNKSNNRFITAHGETHTISEWARILNVNPKALHHRFARGKSPEDIVKPLWS